MSIKLVTDSTFCIGREFAEKHGITTVSLTIRFSDFEYVDGFPEDYAEFYDKLEKSKEFPKTSQPSPEKFAEVFRKITSEGHEVICLTLASALSGTYESAFAAAEGMNGVSVVDTQTVCQSALLLVEEALGMIEAGASRAEIVEKLQVLREKALIEFVPQNLEYLKRGGRMSHLQVAVASVLRVKPVFRFRQNALTVAKKALGMHLAVSELVAQIPSTVKKLFAVQIGSGSPFFDSLIAKIKEKFEGVAIRIGQISPVVGVHVGPGSIGFACISD